MLIVLLGSFSSVWLVGSSLVAVFVAIKRLAAVPFTVSCRSLSLMPSFNALLGVLRAVSFFVRLVSHSKLKGSFFTNNVCTLYFLHGSCWYFVLSPRIIFVLCTSPTFHQSNTSCASSILFSAILSFLLSHSKYR